MFGFRTPSKKVEDSQGTTTRRTPDRVAPAQREGESSRSSGVRRSIGEWESGKLDAHLKTPPTPKGSVMVEPPKLKPKSAISQESRLAARKASVEASEVLPVPVARQKYVDRLSEARACVSKAKINLGNSRNLKSEIKTEVIAAIERLYQLVKEAESVKGSGKQKENEPELEKEPELFDCLSGPGSGKDSQLIQSLEQHSNLMKLTNDKIDNLQNTLDKHQEAFERQTYASVAAAPIARPASEQTALHSVVVTGKNETETGEEVLNRIRTAVNAKVGGVTVERIRKAKDRKVIVGCRTEEERRKFVERLKGAAEHLSVEVMKNKDPLVILRDVFSYNSDEEVLHALRMQNKGIFAEDGKVEIAYKKKTRNPHTHHVVLRVSPHIWQQMTVAGSVLVDLQRVRVADQSPLVQCSLCLGYGHGRRHCTTTLEKCSHCGGPHMRADCADWLANAPPTCCNCTSAKIGKADHNAFSTECPVRRKWDALARATIGYQC